MALSQTILKECNNILTLGGTLVFPTETVYGLGANIFNEEAVRKIYRIKGRSFSKPLTAHISSLLQVKLICNNIPDIFYKLAEKFLPGPLSIIIPNVHPNVPKIVTSGYDTIAIRFPNHNICKEIINDFSIPLAATSANISGSKSPVSFEEIGVEVINKVDKVINGGECIYKTESTVLSIVSNPVVLRQGVLNINEIEEVINQKITKGFRE